MLRQFPFRRAAHGLASALCLALLACSGASGPTEPPDPGPGPQPAPQPLPPAPQPGPPQPAPQPAPPQPAPQPAPPPPAPQPVPPDPADHVIAGVYALTRINESSPGQTVTLVHPDGSVMGLYRFESTLMGLTEEQTWSLTLRYADERNSFLIEDRGSFTRAGEDLRELTLQSDVYGDVFEGRALDGLAAIKYDLDGDGQPETIFAFQRILGSGD